MYYHGHLPARFTVEDIYYHEVEVERRNRMLLRGGVLLDGMPVRHIHIENDGTINLMVTPPELPHGLATYHFHGYQFWQILHNDEEPNKEYTGESEAQLAYIRQITGYRDEDQPRAYHVGGAIIEP